MNRICFVLDSYPPAIGGAETALQQIAKGLAKRNFDVTVITTRFGKDASALSDREGITVVSVRVPRLLHRWWFFILALPYVVQYAKTSEIILGSTYGGVLPAFFGSIILRKKRVMMVHEIMGKRWFQFERNPLKAFGYYVTENILVRIPFHAVVAVSEYTRNELLRAGIQAEILSVIYHGAPDDLRFARRSHSKIRASLGFEKNQYLYLAYGRLGITKGFQYFAQAIPSIIQNVPQARFLLIFSGYDRRIRRMIREALVQVPVTTYRLFDAVSREVLIDYIHAADCIVVPSLSEGFGFAVIEACVAKKTVVATNVGAIPEVVYGSHVLVESGSAVQLARGCREAYEGRISHTGPRDFQWATSIEKWVALFRSLMRKEKGKR
jgi:D-inositol-3-phosphate glycosyltransferase